MGNTPSQGRNIIFFVTTGQLSIFTISNQGRHKIVQTSPELSGVSRSAESPVLLCNVNNQRTTLNSWCDEWTVSTKINSEDKLC